MTTSVPQPDVIPPWVTILEAIAWVCRVTNCSWAVGVDRLQRAFDDDEILTVGRNEVAGQWVAHQITADFWRNWKLQPLKDSDGHDTVNYHWSGQLRVVRTEEIKLPPPPPGTTIISAPPIRKFWEPATPLPSHLLVSRNSLEKRWPDTTRVLELVTEPAAAPVETPDTKPTSNASKRPKGVTPRVWLAVHVLDALEQEEVDFDMLQPDLLVRAQRRMPERSNRPGTRIPLGLRTMQAALAYRRKRDAAK